MSTAILSTAPPRQRLELIDWVDKVCDKCAKVREIHIPNERREALYKTLELRGFPDERRDVAKMWILYGDWNRKKGLKTLEISDFFPSAQQLAPFQSHFVSTRFYRQKLEEVRRVAHEEAERAVIEAMEPTKLQTDLQEMAKILAKKTARILELEAELDGLKRIESAKSTRLQALEDAILDQASRITDNQHWFVKVLNDQFRIAGHLAYQAASMLPSWVLSDDVQGLSDVEQQQIIDAIRTTTDFDPVPNPYHSWGNVTINKKEYWWVISYCAADGKEETGNPWDVGSCRRILEVYSRDELETLKDSKIGDITPL